MAYSELIKNFNRIRDYMREFYVYGFKSRDEYNKKSARSYDDERRRMESWLGDNMQFRQNAEGKNVFISIDSRISNHNPLYRAWKTKSFTDGDITLHFILFDILSSAEIELTIAEIMEEIDDILSEYDEPRYFDESTVRKKLKEYVKEGIIVSRKQGRTMCYRRNDDIELSVGDVLDYFTEVAPCGVIGSYILDKMPVGESRRGNHFNFKHHYITGAMDSEIMRQLFEAMHNKESVIIESINRHCNRVSEKNIVPLKIMISVQNGRQYLMAYVYKTNRVVPYRLDNIVSVKSDSMCEEYDRLREILEKMRPNIWGVSTKGISGQRMEHVEFTVRYEKDEQFIHKRLEREKRCGTVVKIDECTSKFAADVYDAGELKPWIRSYIGRIAEIHFSSEELEKQFNEDIEQMYKMYGIKGGGEE